MCLLRKGPCRREHALGSSLSGSSEAFCLLVDDCGEKEVG